MYTRNRLSLKMSIECKQKTHLWNKSLFFLNFHVWSIFGNTICIRSDIMHSSPAFTVLAWTNRSIVWMTRITNYPRKLNSELPKFSLKLQYSKSQFPSSLNCTQRGLLKLSSVYNVAKQKAFIIYADKFIAFAVLAPNSFLLSKITEKCM